ncbi:MAG: hypothetical protein WCJ40_18585, partial [Planctomycetota bacterium]
TTHNSQKDPACPQADRLDLFLKIKINHPELGINDCQTMVKMTSLSTWQCVIYSCVKIIPKILYNRHSR